MHNIHSTVYTHALLISNMKMPSDPTKTCSKNAMETCLSNDECVRESQVKFAHQFNKR